MIDSLKKAFYWHCISRVALSSLALPLTLLLDYRCMHCFALWPMCNDIDIEKRIISNANFLKWKFFVYFSLCKFQCHRICLKAVFSFKSSLNDYYYARSRNNRELPFFSERYSLHSNLPSHLTTLVASADAINFAMYKNICFSFREQYVRLIVTWRRLSREYVRSLLWQLHLWQKRQANVLMRGFISLSLPMYVKISFIVDELKNIYIKRCLVKNKNFIECWHKISFLMMMKIIPHLRGK